MNAGDLDSVAQAQRLDHAAEQLHKLGELILNGGEIPADFDDQLRALLDTAQRIMTDSMNTMHQDIVQLRKELKEMRADLKGVRDDFDAHDRVGDYCPHTGK